MTAAETRARWVLENLARPVTEQDVAAWLADLAWCCKAKVT